MLLYSSFHLSFDLRHLYPNLILSQSRFWFANLVLALLALHFLLRCFKSFGLNQRFAYLLFLSPSQFPYPFQSCLSQYLSALLSFLEPHLLK